MNNQIAQFEQKLLWHDILIEWAYEVMQYGKSEIQRLRNKQNADWYEVFEMKRKVGRFKTYHKKCVHERQTFINGVDENILLGSILICRYDWGLRNKERRAPSE